MKPDEMKIIQIPEISAIYYGLLQSGYDFCSIERSSEHVNALTKFTGKGTTNDFFAGTRQQTCEVYPYWPRAFILEAATFFLNDSHTAYKDMEGLQRRILSAGNITDRERDSSLWEWLEGFPEALRCVLADDGFSGYMEWEKKWTARQNDAWREELERIRRCLEICTGWYDSPVKEIRICINPIKCVYSSDYHLDGDRFVFTSGAFQAGSVIHEFLHHVVHPVVETQKTQILAIRPENEQIDESYYQDGRESGILNAFEETTVRSLTEDIMRDEYPEDLLIYIKTILDRNTKRKRTEGKDNGF